MSVTESVRPALSPASRQEQIRAQISTLVAEYFSHEPELPADQCPLSVPLYGADEVDGALDSLLTQNVTMGAKVRQFEREFATYVGARHAVMVNSGSSANLLALAVLSVRDLPGALRPGDEVIVPAVTWSTTLAPVVQHGCVPVLVDIDPRTLNLRTDDVEAALSPKTRAVMPVHLLGNPVDMEPLTDLARRHDLWVVEDTCESLGSTVSGRQAGTFGQMGTYSFYFSHHITTIEGGMLVTDDDHLADLARSVRAHGWTRDMSDRGDLEATHPDIDPRFLFVHLGYNLRPTEISAAFGLVQLRRLDEFNAQRRANARYLLDALADLDLQLVTEQPGGRSTWFGFAMIAPDAATRAALGQHLELHGVATRPIVAGNLAHQPAFRGAPHRTVGPLTHADATGARGLFVGNHPNLTPAHLEHVATTVRNFFGAR